MAVTTNRLGMVMDLCEERTGKRPARRTIYNWIHRGVRGTKLAAKLVLGSWMTTADDFDRFVDGQQVSVEAAQ